MPGDIKNKYGTNNQSITCTVASLTNTSARASTVVDNTSNLFQEVLVFVTIKAGGSGTAATGYVDIYAYGTCDGGTNYTEGATGSDAGITLTSPTNLKLIGIINVVANSTSYKAGPFAVSPAFGGSMPDKWGIVVQNMSGGTLDSTGGNHLTIYQGLYSQYT